MIAQIAVAATEQSEAARQSSQNIDAINRLGEESAAAVPETTAIVESVEAGAKRLKEHINRFKVDDGRKQPGSANPPAIGMSGAELAFGD